MEYLALLLIKLEHVAKKKNTKRKPKENAMRIAVHSINNNSVISTCVLDGRW